MAMDKDLIPVSHFGHQLLLPSRGDRILDLFYYTQYTIKPYKVVGIKA